MQGQSLFQTQSLHSEETEPYDHTYILNQFYDAVSFRTHTLLQLLFAFDAVLNLSSSNHTQKEESSSFENTLIDEYGMTLVDCQRWFKESSNYLASCIEEDHDALYVLLCIEEQTDWLLNTLRSPFLEDNPALSTCWSVYQALNDYQLEVQKDDHSFEKHLLDTFSPSLHPVGVQEGASVDVVYEHRSKVAAYWGEVKTWLTELFPAALPSLPLDTDLDLSTLSGFNLRSFRHEVAHGLNQSSHDLNLEESSLDPWDVLDSTSSQNQEQNASSLDWEQFLKQELTEDFSSGFGTPVNLDHFEDELSSKWRIQIRPTRSKITQTLMEHGIEDSTLVCSVTTTSHLKLNITPFPRFTLDSDTYSQSLHQSVHSSTRPQIGYSGDWFMFQDAQQPDFDHTEAYTLLYNNSGAIVSCSELNQSIIIIYQDEKLCVYPFK